MMKAIVKFYENCIRVLTETSKRDKKISMAIIEKMLSGPRDVIPRINSMKFILPSKPEHEVREEFDNLHQMIDQRFQDLLQSTQ